MKINNIIKIGNSNFKIFKSKFYTTCSEAAISMETKIFKISFQEPYTRINFRKSQKFSGENFPLSKNQKEGGSATTPSPLPPPARNRIKPR